MSRVASRAPKFARPIPFLSPLTLLPVAVSLAALLVSGCAQKQYNGPVADGSMAHVTPAHMTRMPKPHVPELEDDGLPVQTAPLRRRGKRVDDPNEPFSPNYGPDAATPPQDAGYETEDGQRLSIDEEGGWRARRAANTWAPIPAGRQNSVIARAMSAHEQRHP
ncbi:MAG: hypothetical protein AAGJ53_00305 [Pseudomonadota bacterium]